MVAWKQDDAGNQKNTAVAASGYEDITFSDSRYKKGFNYLEVVNLDAVDIELRFNGGDDAGNVVWVPAGTSYVMPAEDGRTFDFIHAYNLNAGVAETANTILFRAARMIRIPEIVARE